ncbi:secreted RxLR effector protein 161-like [Arachis hypogaea]|uniref:secreted RxLR effector protein 161-like n=1 Tax=Arachis hypogaea TaxID=3818 RepID=UPI0007AF5ADC
MYLTISRPDITFAVTKLAQFMSDPRVQHLNAVHQILRYLKAAPGQGILFFSNSKLNLSIYTDADWGSCLNTRRSIIGYCTFLGDSLISWKSKKQPVVSRSSTEVEYRAMANAVYEVVWLTNLLRFMDITIDSAMFFCDNLSSIQLVSNLTFHERSKHIEIDCHFIREKVEIGFIKLVHFPTKHQLADILTKAISKPQFLFLMSKLETYNLYAPT